MRTTGAVYVRGEAWRVVDAEPFDGCTLLTVTGAEAANLGETSRFLVPFDRVRAAGSRPRIAAAPRRAAVHAAAQAVLHAHRWQDLWTAATARIDLLPWQLEPAIAVVRGAARVLLADHVGLGKTIQAALILAELRARRLAARCLILTPASLRDQWAGELLDRFAIRAAVFDHTTLASLTPSLPPGVNPWLTGDVIVSSIDLVKRPELRAALEGVPFDVLIVDEAHHLTPGSDRGALVEELASRVPWVVFATATPHSGDERAYAYLQQLGSCSDAAPPTVFRRSSTIASHGQRRVHVQPLTPSPAERTLFEATMSYATAIWRGTTDPHARLLAAVLARRGVSSAAALLRTLTRRSALLAERDGPPAVQTVLPWSEDEVDDDHQPDHVVGAFSPATNAGEAERLQHLIALACAAAGEESRKIRFLRRLLRRTGEAAIVFSEYRDTIEHLMAALRDVNPAVLHGGLSGASRRRAIAAFSHGETRLLLATDAAGEGLNLQARCRLVVNIELPWNPLRLEQRIGRVDRLGQTRRVHAIHLVCRGSFEEQVLARLEQRLARARMDLADAAPSEVDVTSAVFDGQDATPRTVAASAAARSMTADASRLLLQRRLASSCRPQRLSRRRIPVATTRRRRRIAGALLLFSAHIHDSHHRRVSADVIPLAVRFVDRAALSHEAFARLVQRLVVDRDVEATVAREVARLGADAEHVSAAAAAFERRVLSVIEHLARSAQGKPVQASLFDRRAEQQAHARAEAVARWRGHLERRLSSIRALPTTDAPAVHLVAALALE